MGGTIRQSAICLLLLLTALFPSNVLAQVTSSSTVSFTINGGVTSGSIQLVGDAFPHALVTFTQNGATAGTANANANSRFDKTFTGLSAGSYTYALYATAADGRKTLTISFSVSAIAGTTTTVSGILLPAIIGVTDRHKRPAPLREEGLAKNSSTVTTFTNSDTITRQTTSNGAGEWSTTITDILHIGPHSATAVVSDSLGNQSNSSAQEDFQVVLSADLNIDDFVNLTDFSILMFSYGNTTPPNKAADINDSGSAPDLVDFSVMMFYWSR